MGTVALIAWIAPGCTGGAEAVEFAADAGQAGGVSGCHNPDTVIPVAPENACRADPAFVDPDSSASDLGVAAESFAFFFARRCANDGAAEVRSCTVADLRDTAACDVSIGCATCYADFGRCVNTHCWGECLRPECTTGPSASDPEQWVNDRCPDLAAECDACRCGRNSANVHCFSELEACAGVELEALAEACGRGGG